MTGHRSVLWVSHRRAELAAFRDVLGLGAEGWGHAPPG
jgi:hypothetical protein